MVVLHGEQVVEVNTSARRFGIAPGFPVSAVMAICPQMVLVDGKAEDAGRQRERWLRRCAQWALAVEPIDENTTLLDWRGFADGGREAFRALLAEAQTMGITVTAGYGVGRLSAQVALRKALCSQRTLSMIPKPLSESLMRLPLNLLPDEYADLVERCGRMGWKRFDMLSRVSLQQAVALVGKGIAPAWYLVQGHDNPSVRALYPPPEWERRGEFVHALTEEMVSALWHHTAQLAEHHLRAHSGVAKRLELSVGYANGTRESWECLLMPPIQEATHIARHIVRLWGKRQRQLRPARWRLCIVWEPDSRSWQMALQEVPSPHGELQDTVRFLCARFGAQACFRLTQPYSDWNRQMRRFYEPHDLSLYTGGVCTPWSTPSASGGR